MTALCGGGTSAAKAGVADTIIFTAGALSSLLNNKGGYWATLAAPLLGVLAYDATSLCGTDPPAQPTITADEYQALLQLSPWNDLTSALGKLADIAKRLIWFDMCECTSVATPALPTNTLTPPANVTIPNYGGTGSCPQPRARLDVPLFSSGNLPSYTCMTRQMFPGFPIYQIPAGTSWDVQEAIALPSSWTSIGQCADFVSSSGTCAAGHAFAAEVTLWGPTRLLLSSPASRTVTSTNPHDCTSTPFVFNHTTQRYLSINTFHDASCTADGVLDYSLTIACGGTATTGADCCADPAVLALLGLLVAQTNLIQRQIVPFGYVPGAVHAGLADTGELAVQGLLGARVELTTSSVLIGEEDGTPEQLFEAGWVAWGNADGFAERQFLTNGSLLSFPPVAGQYTRFAYTFPPGAVVSITELVREP